jgi:hypothetical protein
VRLREPVKLSVAAVGAAALGVSAASAVVGGGPPGPAPQSHAPVSASVRIGPTAADPAGGIDWALRLYTSTSGASCAEAGRLTGGRFGQIDAAGIYRALPLEAVAACGDLTAEPVIVAVNAYPARGARAARTVLFGRASPAVAGVLVQRRDGSLRARPPIGAAGGFLLPLAGTIAASELPVTITLDGGGRRIYDWR